MSSAAARDGASGNGLVGYRKEWLRFDVVAGLTAAAVVVPKAMAYATGAGLPVQIGIYTAFVPMVVYAFLGTSRVLSVSTTTTIAILTGAALAEGGTDDPAAKLTALVTLTLIVGAILGVSSILRLGFVANFISEPVLIGFKAGIGVVIIADQIPKLLGLHVSGKTFLQKLVATFEHLGETHLPTLGVAALMLAILIGLERFVPQIPAPLVAVAAGIAGAGLLGWKDAGVGLVGHIPTGLPGLALPDLSLVGALWPAAI